MCNLGWLAFFLTRDDFISKFEEGEVMKFWLCSIIDCSSNRQLMFAVHDRCGKKNYLIFSYFLFYHLNSMLLKVDCYTQNLIDWIFLGLKTWKGAIIYETILSRNNPKVTILFQKFKESNSQEFLKGL